MNRTTKSQSTISPWLLSQKAVESLSHATAPWTARSEALLALLSCAKAVGEDQARAHALSKQIESLSQPLATCVSDLRSAIVRQSCEAIHSLAPVLGAKLADAASSDLMPALIRRASTRKLVMRESASMAALKASFSTSPRPFLSAPLQLLFALPQALTLASSFSKTVPRCLKSVVK